MARHVADQNQVYYRFESGTYASASGTAQWVGLISNHEIDEELNISSDRYVGQANLNVGIHVTGDQDHRATLTYHPQDWKFLAYALGSCVDGGSPSPYTHVLSETDSDDGNGYTSGTKNPPFSFTVVDAHKAKVDGFHTVRTLAGGVVDTWELAGAQGEKFEQTVEYVAQTNTYTSGAPLSVTASTSKPFLFNMLQVSIPSGTIIDNIKSARFRISRNIHAPHYANGSDVIDQPNLQGRDHEIELTLNQDSTFAKALYDQYFRGGSEFNLYGTIVDKSAGTGSRDLTLSYSGCRIIDMSDPTLNEGTNETTLTIKPTSLSASVNDLIQLYNPG